MMEIAAADLFANLSGNSVGASGNATRMLTPSAATARCHPRVGRNPIAASAGPTWPEISQMMKIVAIG